METSASQPRRPFPQLPPRLVLRDSEWLRGEQSADLTDRDSSEGQFGWLDPETMKVRRCCLGLLAEACGLLAEGPTPIRIPHMLRDYMGPKLDEHPYFLALCDNPLTNTMMTLNDHKHMADEVRVEELRPLFAEIGIELDWRPEE